MSDFGFQFLLNTNTLQKLFGFTSFMHRSWEAQLGSWWFLENCSKFLILDFFSLIWNYHVYYPLEPSSHSCEHLSWQFSGGREGRSVEASNDGDAAVVEASHGQEPSGKRRRHQRVWPALARLQDLRRRRQTFRHAGASFHDSVHYRKIRNL